MTLNSRLYVVASLLAILLTSLPYLYGYTQSTPHARFTGTIELGQTQDWNSHLSWVRQAADGKILLRDKFTTEQHPENFFNLYFLVLGWFSRITGFSPIATYHIFRILFCLFLLHAIRKLVCVFVDDSFRQTVAFLAVVFSAGFGWMFFYGLNQVLLKSGLLIYAPVDLWMSEAIPFQTMTLAPLTAFSLALLLLIFRFLFLAFRGDDPRGAWKAGCLGAVLVNVHPYNVVTAYTVPLFYILASRMFDKNTFWLKLRIYTLFAAISCPALFLHLWTLHQNPVFQEWSKSKTLSTNPLDYVLGFGWTWIFFFPGFRFKKADLISLLSAYSERYARSLFLTAWAAASFLLVFSPFPFQRRLSEGMFVPLCLLAAPGLASLIDVLSKNRTALFKKLVVLAVALFICPSNFILLSENMKQLSQRPYGVFLFPEELSAMKWLSKNTPRDFVVLSSYMMGNYIPAYSGNTVYLGHWDQTLKLEEKKKAFQGFFQPSASPEEQKRFLKENKIHFIFLTWQDSLMRNFKADGLPFLSLIHSNSRVKIYRVAQDK